MSFHDFLRRAFGLPSNPVFGDDGDDERFHRPFFDGGEEDEISEEDEFSNVPSSPFGFHVFTGDPMDMHRYFEHQFNEMLKSFQSMQGSIFGSGLMELPDFGNRALEGPKEPLTEESIRDKYLKPSLKENRPSPEAKADLDLDEEVSNHGLKALIPSGPGGMGHDIPQRVYGRSIITKTVRLPDGTITHEKRVRGSDGNEEVTVTRQFGDRKHTVTTTTDSSGLEKRTEEFVNLDENMLNDFENKSHGAFAKPETSRDPLQPPSLLPESGLLKLLEQFFK